MKDVGMFPNVNMMIVHACYKDIYLVSQNNRCLNSVEIVSADKSR